MLRPFTRGFTYNHIFSEDEVKLALYTKKNKFLLSFHYHQHISIVFLTPPACFYCFPSTTSTFLLFSFHQQHVSIVSLPPPPHFYCFSFYHHHVSFVFLPPQACFYCFSFHHQHVSIVLTPQLYRFLPSHPFAQSAIHLLKRFSHPLVTDVNDGVPPPHFWVGSNSSYSAGSLRACLHGSGGPQVGEVTCLGGVTGLSI